MVSLCFFKVYVFNPEYIKEIYKADSSTPFRPAADPMVKLHERIGIKLDLINSQGERWRKLRSLANPVMARPQNIHLYLKNHNRIANDLVDIIEQKFSTDENGQNEIFMSNFEQVIRLLTLECRFNFLNSLKNHFKMILYFSK